MTDTFPTPPTAPFHPRTIFVWEWDDAPAEYRALSEHGGDEDWVAFVPDGVSEPLWLSEGTPFGCCDVSEHPVHGGFVYIGAHA